MCKQLTLSICAALGLANNLFSWEKERDAAKRDGFSHVLDFVWVLITERSLTKTEAKDLCRLMIKNHAAEYLRVAENIVRERLFFQLT